MDRVTQAVVDALKQALAEPGEQRLYRSGKLTGLFPGRTGVNGEAAARALREGLLEATRTETRGKTAIEWVRLTPRGVEFLHEHESPVRALADLRDVLRANQTAIPVWLEEMGGQLHVLSEKLAAAAAGWMQRLEALSRRVEEALRRIEEAVPPLPQDVQADHPWAVDALNYLDRRRNGGANGDCPLPELFAALVRQHEGLSVHRFHDGLRKLHDRHALKLRPASPDQLAQPEYALFDEGNVLYFAAR
jgi:DNA-binding PadR family transcriptional regulator